MRVIIVWGASYAARLRRSDEKAARELLEEEWKKITTSKLPQTADPLASAGRVG